MTIHFTIHVITLWLLGVFAGLIVLGPILCGITARWLEIGALACWSVCWALAAVILVLAIGSML